MFYSNYSFSVFFILEANYIKIQKMYIHVFKLHTHMVKQKRINTTHVHVSTYNEGGLNEK